MDGAIAAVALRQQGLVTTAQLREIGLAQSTINLRIAAGRLHRIHRGVYAVGHASLSREARWRAAVLAAGRGAALSHLAAAALWGITRHAPERIDVVVTRRHAGLGTIQVHQSRNLLARDVTTRHAIPVTTVARTLLDLGDVLDAFQLANVMHEAAYRRRLDLRSVREVARRARGRAASTVLRDALRLHESGSVGTRSNLEDAFLARLRAAGLPEPLVNVRVPIGGGASLEVDVHWPDSRTCVELDGPAHARPRTRSQDRERDAALRRAGWRVLRCRPGTIDSTIVRLASLLAPVDDARLLQESAASRRTP